MDAPLTVACLPAPPTADITANATTISTAIQHAAQHGAALLVTNEAALTGYPSKARDDLETVDWKAVAAREDELAEQAGEHGIGLLLGSGSLYRDGISNDLLVCGAVPKERRYRKCCLTQTDQAHYLAGDDIVVVEIGGWRLGVSICFDLRFPDLWGAAIAAGAEAFINSASMSGADYDNLKTSVVPAMLVARAAESGRPVVACNTADDEAWYPSQVIDHRGAVTVSAADGLTDGLLVSTLDPLPETGWYTSIREMATSRWQAVFPHLALAEC